MSLSSIQLDAFFEVARMRSFSQAAKNLHLTQSALSQRVLNLEDELGSALFVREPSGLRLTENGQKLLRYCQVKEGLENETLFDLGKRKERGLGGEVRLGSFSSVMRSVLLPSLGEVIQENPGIQIETFVREMRELPELFRHGEIDYLVLDQALNRKGIETHLLGYEENVLVRPSKKSNRTGVYLDHDPEDKTTETFFALQKNAPKSLRRSFMDDIYGIINGVSLGWGSAVVPKHLIQKQDKVHIVSGQKPLKVPLYLHYYTQPFYTELHNHVVAALKKNAKRYL